jgi:hypothetical protein
MIGQDSGSNDRTDSSRALDTGAIATVVPARSNLASEIE